MFLVLLGRLVILSLFLTLAPSGSGLLLHLLRVFKDTFLAKWLLTHVYDWFREVFFADILIHQLLLLLQESTWSTRNTN